MPKNIVLFSDGTDTAIPPIVQFDKLARQLARTGRSVAL
jgi:hypothetical protein